MPVKRRKPRTKRAKRGKGPAKFFNPFDPAPASGILNPRNWIPDFVGSTLKKLKLKKLKTGYKI